MRGSIRILGLVRAFRFVRRRMERGVPQREAEALRAYIRRVVAEVEGICRAHGAQPSDLPRPSREAYGYLAGLVAADAQPPLIGKAAPPFSLPSVIRTRNILLGSLSERLRFGASKELLAEYAEPVRQAARQIEEACRRHGRTPADLPPPSRRAYALMAFLASDGALARYAETVAQLHRLCAPLLQTEGRTGSLRIFLDDQTGLYRYRRRGETAILRLNPGFFAADTETLAAVAGEIFGRRERRRKAVIHEFVHSEAFLGVGQELADLVAGEPETRGAVYDLAEVCERVRRTCFHPPAKPPASLAWTDRLTYHTFGHYNSLRDRITISRSLDDRSVPQYVVDFIMYHELLHKVHGIGWAVSRRAMHTTAFRADERKFPRYAEAQAFVNRLASRLRRRLR